MRDLVLVYPNRGALGLGALIVGMWYAGASQNNGAAYLLCFVLLSVGLVALPNTWSNLRGISVRGETIRPAFAGDELRVPIVATSEARKARYAIRFRPKGSSTPGRVTELRRGTPARVEALLLASKRGAFTGVDLIVDSHFPFGFFTARRSMTLAQPYHVYPRPEGSLPLPMTFDPARDTKEGARAEGDDYAGVRSWIPGESMRHIDWKAVSRGQPYMTKQWTSDAGHRLILEWDQLAPLPAEARLSQLARWIVDSENQSLDYGLRLPGKYIEPGRGADHFHRCLRALASFPSDFRDAEPRPNELRTATGTES
jgi:uncharacterized protein (DUF58 family)